MTILGILAHFEQENPENVIKNIVEKLQTISQKNPRFKKKPPYDKYFIQLSTLARIRDLQALTLQIIKSMALTLDYKKDAFYTEGIEQGIEKNKIETILKAHKKGMKPQEIANFLDIEVEYVKNVIKNNK